MRDDARIQAAIDLLSEVVESPRPADGVASEFFRSRRYIGSKDRRAVADRMWGVMRRWARLSWWVRWAMAQIGEDAPEWDRVPVRWKVIADLVLSDGWTLPAIEERFTGDKFAPHPLGPREKAMIRALKGRPLNAKEMPAWVRGEVPEWVVPRLEHLYGEHLPDLLASLDAEAPTDLRVNTLKTNLEEAVAELAGEQVEAVPTLWSPLALRLESRVNLPATKAFRDGLVEVQDEGSQLVALLTDARPGMAVCDFCAGAGGKTLGLAARMENKGRLTACDVSAGRMDRSAQRLKRAGVHNVTRHVLSSEHDKWVKRHKGTYDRVLVDAPCTGSGTWRRNPDAKWRLTEEGLAELTERQASILASAARLVKPGGRLVYATCSLLPEENDAQVGRFLEAQGEAFRVVPVPAIWAEAVGSERCPVEGGYLHLDPARHGTDGFFVAVLERVV